MDLMSVDTVKASSDGAAMNVMHPTENTVMKNDDGSPMTITLLGTDSDVYRKAQRVAVNRRLRSGRRGISTAEELDADALDLMATASLKWNITVGSEQPAFSRDAARDLYAKLPWLREQVDAFINDRSNFLKASVTT